MPRGQAQLNKRKRQRETRTGNRVVHIMTDIFIEKTNASFLTIHVEDAGIHTHIYEYFKYKQPQFVKNRWSKWDGTVRLFNKNTNRLPLGLLYVFLKFCKMSKYSVEMDESLKSGFTTDITREQLQAWVDDLELHSGGNPITPYDYQFEALYLSIRMRRLTVLAATSAGKSLIIYMLIRFFDEIGYDAGRTLLIVPSIGLVTQMFNDFKDYSSVNGWDTENKCHCISEGAARTSRKPVYISTWQSLLDMPNDYFHQFDRIIVDECHLASGKSITSVCNNSINAEWRIGLTGTLNGTALHELQVAGLFGPIKRVVTTRELIDSGRASRTEVNMLNLNYPLEDKRAMKGAGYDEELNWLIRHGHRNKAIKTLATTLKGNSLFLFNRREKHLEMLFNELVALNLPGKKFYMIVGGVSGEEREEIKQKIENSEEGVDVIVFATARTTSTGWSVKKLHNLVFCFSTKSVIMTLQSVGRLLRLHDSKDIAKIWDLVDNLKIDNYTNPALKHAFERYGYYNQEGHDIKVTQIDMKSYQESTTT